MSKNTFPGSQDQEDAAAWINYPQHAGWKVSMPEKENKMKEHYVAEQDICKTVDECFAKNRGPAIPFMLGVENEKKSDWADYSPSKLTQSQIEYLKGMQNRPEPENSDVEVAASIKDMADKIDKMEREPKTYRFGEFKYLTDVVTPAKGGYDWLTVKQWIELSNKLIINFNQPWIKKPKEPLRAEFVTGWREWETKNAQLIIAPETSGPKGLSQFIGKRTRVILESIEEIDRE